MNNPFDKESWTEQEREIINAGGWQCSFCALINASYITSCACGHNRDDSYENLHGRYVPREDEEYTEEGAATEPVVPSASDATETTVEIPETPAPETMGMPVEIPAAEPPETVVSAEPEIPASAPANVSAPAAPPVKVSKTNRPMEEYTAYEQGILNDGGWECAFCERINANYITTCACGHSSDDSFMKRRGKYKGPDAEEETAQTAAPTVSAPTAPASAGSDSTASSAGGAAAELTPAEMIAEIEQELAADNSEMAKFRAIRKYKNLMKKGYMSKEEFNQRQDELLSFEDEEAMEAPGSAGEDHA